MLSNIDILNELNENVFIDPLNLKNIKGSSINLTASKNAWSLKNKVSIVNGDVIEIPANDTALIMTNELIHVTSKIAGLYHSKVSLVSKGTGHIGTTLDPEWYGQSLIAIHNLSSDICKIKVDETFVSLTLYYLNSEEEGVLLDNHGGRCDILKSLGIDCDGMGEETQENLNTFKKRCKESYQNIVKKEKKSVTPFYKRVAFQFIISVIVMALFVFACVCFDGEQKVAKEYVVPVGAAFIVFALNFVWGKINK